MMKPKPYYEARAAILKAMAHPSRLLLLDLLNEREISVTELTELVGVDQSTVSRHLALLRGAGLVTSRKKGVTVFYRVRLCCLEGFFTCVESVLADNLRQQQAASDGCPCE